MSHKFAKRQKRNCSLFKINTLLIQAPRVVICITKVVNVASFSEISLHLSSEKTKVVNNVTRVVIRPS